MLFYSYGKAFFVVKSALALLFSTPSLWIKVAYVQSQLTVLCHFLLHF